MSATPKQQELIIEALRELQEHQNQQKLNQVTPDEPTKKQKENSPSSTDRR